MSEPASADLPSSPTRPITESIPWIDIQLRLATKNEFVTLEILCYLYVNPAEPVLFMILHKKFKRQRICSNRATVWKRRLKLEQMGLVRILHGNPISLWPTDSVNPEKIKLLVTRCYKSLMGEFYAV